MIPVPELTDQTAIVGILDAISRYVSALEKRKLTLESIFDSLLHNLMTGKARVGESQVADAAGRA
jgi:type I restriction enzyme S subunit